MPTTSTRTLNPLPFEHMEPKRFEDLARQLAYNFKPWRQLEATGRTGSDDGFDARGFEIVSPQAILRDDDDDEEPPIEASDDRVWLIQCKREKSITPSRMAAHLADIPPQSLSNLYGIVFVAACDFSKATRDVLRRWSAEHGIAETHIWGRAELEDFLYQPVNDHLLFAYFGISLQIRRTKIATDIRRRTTIKRKLKRLLQGHRGLHGHPVILRDPSDDRYPYSGEGRLEKSDCLWRVVYAVGLGVNGLKILVREHMAYFVPETQQWDIASAINMAIPMHHEHPWHQGNTPEEQAVDEAGRHFWLSVPDKTHYTAHFVAEIAYSDIIEIDDVASEIELPEIFVSFKRGRPPYTIFHYPVLNPPSQWAESVILNDELTHIRVFPEASRDIEWEEHFAENEGLKLSKQRAEVELTPPQWIVELQKRRSGIEPTPGDDTEGAVDV